MTEERQIRPGERRIRILRKIHHLSDGGPMTYFAGNEEIAWVNDDGTVAEINWGCGQILELYGDAFEIISPLELLAREAE